MPLTEEIAEERCVRPGRTIYIRKCILGDVRKDPVNLVFVHGTNGSQAQFDPMLQLMGDMEIGCDNSIIVWMYDMVGCGQSPLPPTEDYSDPNMAYSNMESALDLNAILNDMVDTTHPTYFVGHSYGPTILLELLHLQEFQLDNVQGMVFISSALRDGPLTYPDGGPMIMKLPLCVLKCINPLLAEGFLKLSFHSHTFSQNPSLVQKTRQSCLENNLQVCQAYLKQHKWATSLLAQEAKDMPVLIVHGEEDSNIPPSCSQHLANVLPMSKLQYIEKASHLVILEKPKEVGKFVLEFVSQIQCVYLVRDGFPPMS